MMNVLENLIAQFFLQEINMTTYSRLVKIEFLASSSETVRVNNRLKRCELPKTHRLFRTTGFQIKKVKEPFFLVDLSSGRGQSFSSSGLHSSHSISPSLYTPTLRPLRLFFGITLYGKPRTQDSLCVILLLMQAQQAGRIFLLITSLIVLYFVFQIFQPFLVPICLAAILASLCYPVFYWTCTKLKGRRNWAALITSLGVTVIIVIPFVVLLILVAGQVWQFQAGLEKGEFENSLDFRGHPYFGPVVIWINQYVDLEKLNLMGSLTSALQQGSLFLLRHATAILSGLVQFFTSFFVMLVTMFFLFRDGALLTEELKSWIPFSERYEQLIVRKFQEVASATIVGNLLTSVAQGAASGVVFWIVGIPNVMLWGTLTALFSLVPVFGTALIWFPWAVYLFLTGAWLKGMFLVVLEVLFVGMIDNVLRPILIEGKTKIHTLLVFFAIMGGIGYFGIVGIIFGPILLALGLTFIELYKIEFSGELAKPSEE